MTLMSAFHLAAFVVSLACLSMAMKTPTQVLTELNATKFLDIVQKANDQRILGGNTDDLYTVLVPSDAAFNKLSSAEQNNLENIPGLLQDVLGVHVIPGQLFSWDFVNGRVIVTDNGHFVRVYEPNQDSTYLNSAKVVRWDVEAKGVVFIVIDTVLDAPEGTIYEVLRGPDFGLNIFADMVDKAQMNNTLHQTAGPYTVFVPSQTAWDNLPDTIKDEFSRNIGLLRSVVQYHIHRGSLHVKSLDRNGTLNTFYGNHLIHVSVTNDIKLNRVAGLEEVDIDCDNGVIHIIDHFLFPSTAGSVIGKK
ncbi:transforming growth factor-beta-induced protein ig-h3 [Plakobranchus ocellatus]|uniref:Transforming growth factor-beta-induced protein ig-h3 n=1 Tax=Plakobranchus ocellatus TaxID=259542 RepID=A0AAV4DNI1_9GAST|nr:transforming growth factor-beta-induced protein ig-h3 [Plakobranchus ocellatus]